MEWSQVFLEFMMPRHLSAYSQYSRHELFLSGLFHSAPHSVHSATSSSLQISTSAPHTWHLTYDGVGLRNSRSPGQVSGFLTLLSLLLIQFTSDGHDVTLHRNLFS